MKSIFVKRSIILVLCALVMSLNCTTAFASELPKTETMKLLTTETTYPQTDTSVVPVNDFVTMRFTLASTKSTMRFVVNAFSYYGTTGTLNFYLYSPNNTLVDNWTMGVNEVGFWTFSYPSTGNWMLVIIPQNTTEEVDIFAGWVDPSLD